MANLKLVVTPPEYAQSTFEHAAGVTVKNLVPKRSLQQGKVGKAEASYSLLGVVLAAHVLGLFLLLSHQAQVVALDKPEVAMMVSLVSNPAPKEVLAKEPQVMPTQEMTKPKPVIKQKLIVTETPAKNPVENDPSPKEAASNQAEAEPVKVAQAVEAKPAEESISSKAESEPFVEPPKFGAAYLNNPAPNYPGMARRQGEQGRVLLKVLVAEDGHAEKVQLENSSGYNRLDEAAIEAVKQWTFIPAKRSNQPISAYVLVPIKFSLNS